MDDKAAETSLRGDVPLTVTSLAGPANAVAPSASARAVGDGRRPATTAPPIYRQVLHDPAGVVLSDAYASHVFVIALTPQGRVVDCDGRGEAFLRLGTVLRVAQGVIVCADAARQPGMLSALRDAAVDGRTRSLLLQASDCPERRFCVTLTPARCRLPAAVRNAFAGADLLCLVAPLDHQRIATARQLMDLFGLSGAEARLARALCHGDSAEAYAREQGVCLATVRTQLSAVFKKTGTARQVALVRLIASIPVVRDASG